MNKVWVALAPPPDLKTVKAKVVSWSSTIHRPGENHVKIHNQKQDYRIARYRPRSTPGGRYRYKAIVTLKLATERKTRYDRLAGRVTNSGSITQPRLNESHPTSSRRGRAHTR
jgi:hypothetical protein